MAGLRRVLWATAAIGVTLGLGCAGVGAERGASEDADDLRREPDEDQDERRSRPKRKRRQRTKPDDLCPFPDVPPDEEERREFCAGDSFDQRGRLLQESAKGVASVVVDASPNRVVETARMNSGTWIRVRREGCDEYRETWSIQPPPSDPIRFLERHVPKGGEAAHAFVRECLPDFPKGHVKGSKKRTWGGEDPYAGGCGTQEQDGALHVWYVRSL